MRGDLMMTEALNEKYKLEKKQRGYVISSIQDKAVCIATQLLAGKVMRKCHENEVPTVVFALAKQCAEGEWLNWSQFLCDEFLTNCGEA